MQHYCSLHNHTEYSNLRGFLDAIVRPDELVQKANSLGYSGIAITDHDVLSCHVDERLLGAVSKIKEERPDFKLILGNEIYLIGEENYRECRKFHHFLLLAKDKRGHEQLRELSSRAWERSFVSSGITRTPTFYSDIEEVVGRDRGHLIALTACLGGELGSHIINRNGDGITKFIDWCISNFGKENFFLEMQAAISEEQQDANSYIIKLSEFFGIPYVITDDTHYLDKEDFPIHSAYLNSRGSGDRETESFYKYTYLKSPKETKELLIGTLSEEQIDKGLQNSALIYDMIEDYSLLQSVIVPYREPPKFELGNIFKDYYHKYEYIRNFAESEYIQDRYLLYLIEEGFKNKNWPFDERHLSRIDIELQQVWIISDKLGQRLSSYFELVREIVQLAWSAGSTVGIARGSVSCFSICYLLDIIQINGLDYDLPYWRFLNQERVELPDIDMDFNPFLKDKIMEKVREHYGSENVLNTITYKTESTKSAILSSCRGLEIPVEEAQVLSSMVPMVRGKVLSLDTCLNGNEENEPVSGFKEALSKYPKLEDTIRKIEGLISGRGVHASSVYIFNNGYLTQNSLMRAPNGTLITAFNMHQSDSMGALKMDFLYTEAQSKIGACLKSLLDDGLIEWQGSLFETYGKYIHPDNLIYDNREMWEKVGRNEIPDLFQFDTQVGLECAKKVKPENVNELTLANSVMRLMGDGEEKPIDRFVRFKNNIQEWYDEMTEWGLTQEEQQVLINQMGESYGCSIEQERLMLLVMDEKISGLDLKWANKIRKAVAKKSKKVLEEVKDKFYENGLALGNSQKILDYVWKYGIGPQIGYSFARPHCLAYSLIALQEMNLATRYPKTYWACACLTVNARQGVADDEDSEEISSAGTSDYGKISKAISKMQQQDIKIAPLDINYSYVDFKPDIENNSILFGFGGLKGVSTDYFKEIIDNRPYNSFKDFYDKITLPTAQMLSLIKANAFKNIEKDKTRKNIILEYLGYEIAKNSSMNKDKLTMANFGKIVESGKLPSEYESLGKLYYYKEWLESNCKDADKIFYIFDEETPIRFFENNCRPFLEDKDFNFVEKCCQLSIKAFKKMYDNRMKPIKEWLTTEDAISLYNNVVQQTYIDGLFDKYCQGTDEHWDMDSMGYYSDRHELDKLILPTYASKEIEILQDFEALPQQMEKGKDYYLMGTVVDVNKNKKLVSLLTVNNGVVDVKFNDALFIKYNKKIIEIDSQGKKIVKDESWLTKGCMIIVNGARREGSFVCKKAYSSSRFTVALIERVVFGGGCSLRYKRNEE